MKGIILAGGTGSRLRPLTQAINKHLLPIGKYPMIYYPIFKLRQAGIKDILIVTGPEHISNMVTLLGSGKNFDVSFTYKIQDQPGGIAQALSLAKDFANGELLTVILGDNLLEDSILPFVEEFISQGTGAKILIKEVIDPQRYGVPEIMGNYIRTIEEKPLSPKSSFAVTGIYMYDTRVFDIIDSIKPSPRGELEITDVNNAYLLTNGLTFDIITGWWIDAGTHASLTLANDLCKNITLDFESFINLGKNNGGFYE